MLLSAFIFGLLGSFHCVGMCGPIAFLLPLDRKSKSKKLVQVFIYHLGRLLAYSIIGLLFGLLGKSLYLFGMQQQLSIAVGVLMILAILLPQRTFGKYNFSQPIYRLISKVKSSLAKELRKKTADTFLTVGFLNGFLPCGLVYMAIFGALASGGALHGGIYMVFFGLGTIPLMTSAIYIGNFLNGTVRSRIRKAVPYFVVILGLLFILRGMGFGIPYLSPEPVKAKIGATYNCH